MKLLFNDGWKFTKQKLGTMPESLDKSDIEWSGVDIPHDWLIYDANNLYETGEGWYKKCFDLNAVMDHWSIIAGEDSRSTAGIVTKNTSANITDKLVSIRFEGVYMDSTVYVNGSIVGEWKYGYSTFEFNITKYIKPGENEIKVRVVYQSPNSRWYSGAGIYRNVWLRISEPVHFVPDGIYISARRVSETDSEPNSCWRVEIDSEIADRVGRSRTALVIHTIIGRDFGEVAISVGTTAGGGDAASGGTTVCGRKSAADGGVTAGNGDVPGVCDAASNGKTAGDGDVAGSETVTSGGEEEACGKVAACRQKTDLLEDVVVDKQVLVVKDPHLWSLDDPYLYMLKSELVVDGVIMDTVIQDIGFRSLRLDCDKGFFLNDKHVKLHGACQHHDLGALGAAVNRAALKRQLAILKEMGVNAVRTAHNMPAAELMELADEMGFLILSEAFDMWERSKTEYDYARFFNEWCEKDVASWVRRDRNHPSLIMWSIGNEIYDTHVSDRGVEITRMLRDLVLEHDPGHNGFITIGSNYMRWENAQRCAEELQAAGYNYSESLYGEHHKKHPHWVIFGSETSSTLQSRGIYHFPAGRTVMTHEDEQCSSLGNCTTSWGAKNSQRNIIDDRDAEFSLGQFIWSGFDYIGEPTPYLTKNSYFGQIDTAGFPKDSFYLYQAEWTDCKMAPMVHILPYWDFNEGQIIDIRIYSNAPKTELFFNDESQGVFEIDHKKGMQLSGEWQLPYKKGVIKAVAYDEDGRVIAADVQSSFGDASKIVLKADKTSMLADGQDMIFVETSMEDKDGNPVPNANNRVEVTVTGAGRLVGLDNGDSTDTDSYKGTSRRLFSGKLLVMIAARQEAGEIRITVSSPGLETQEETYHATATSTASGVIFCKAEFDDPPFIVSSIYASYDNSTQCKKTYGVSSLTENERSEPKYEIPIRKIELTNHGRNHLDKENPSTTISARLLPENTTYGDIEWNAVTPEGIVTDIAKVDVNGTEACVTALGDGEFRLRCTARNGRRTPGVVSELEFVITGMGKK